MLFNSYEYLLLFLPLALIGFFLLARLGGAVAALSWLVVTSLFFYAWWKPVYLTLLLPMILFNYLFGLWLDNTRSRGLLVLGLLVNLGVLGYYKYANFFVDNVALLTGVRLSLETVVLPLAISFFTFQHIAYLVDSWQGRGGERSLLKFSVFVCFFPQLIAGPIVHHKEMLPQFDVAAVWRPQWSLIAQGMTLFALGLAKKVLLADDVAQFATPVFAAADAGETVYFLEAWGAALSYTLQLYFDFSGYADMAIGAALMFGIRLPINFNSPYKATSIIDFWRRWHMTLSRFLRDYVYIPLGGNRYGSGRRYGNLMATMLLGGLWHGAGWNFLIWGGLHGLYLTLNHGWRNLRERLGWGVEASTPLGRFLALSLTFLAVVVAWVLFRAETLSGALAILSAMADPAGLRLLPETAQRYSAVLGMPLPSADDAARFVDWSTVKRLLGGAVIIWCLPNSLQFVGYLSGDKPLPRWLSWKPSLPALLWVFLLLFLSLSSMDQVSEFLYFQF